MADASGDLDLLDLSFAPAGKQPKAPPPRRAWETWHVVLVGVAAFVAALGIGFGVGVLATKNDTSTPTTPSTTSAPPPTVRPPVTTVKPAPTTTVKPDATTTVKPGGPTTVKPGATTTSVPGKTATTAKP